MRMPFELLMQHVISMSDEEMQLPLGALSIEWGEPSERIMDAIDAIRVMAGEKTYISPEDN
jgi:hypothetical protein